MHQLIYKATVKSLSEEVAVRPGGDSVEDRVSCLRYNSEEKCWTVFYVKGVKISPGNSPFKPQGLIITWCNVWLQFKFVLCDLRKMTSFHVKPQCDVMISYQAKEKSMFTITDIHQVGGKHCIRVYLYMSVITCQIIGTLVTRHTSIHGVKIVL